MKKCTLSQEAWDDLFRWLAYGWTSWRSAPAEPALRPRPDAPGHRARPRRDARPEFLGALTASAVPAPARTGGGLHPGKFLADF